MALKYRRTLLIRLAISAALLILILLTAPYLHAQEEALNQAEIPAVESPTERPTPPLFFTPDGE